jgi:hypothetical protein
MTAHFRSIVALCPHCGQQMRDMRAGVRLTPIKARIFDLVARAGAQGIDADDINRIVFDGQRSRDVIKAHICQINDLLAATDLRIRGSRGQWHQPPWPYRLVTIKETAQ